MTPEEKYAALLHAVSDEVVSAVVQLHAPVVTRSAFGGVWAECHGCDYSGYDGDAPDWPCRTILAINTYAHVDAIGYPL